MHKYVVSMSDYARWVFLWSWLEQLMDLTGFICLAFLQDWVCKGVWLYDLKTFQARAHNRLFLRPEKHFVLIRGSG